MAYSSNRLPSRFPFGTKFVIEGKRRGEGRVSVQPVSGFQTARFCRCKPGRAKSGAPRRPRRSRSGPLTQFYRPGWVLVRPPLADRGEAVNATRPAT
jgi:hypothetical protein